MRPDPSSPRRSLLKGVTWETIAFFLTFILAWMIFGQVIVCGVFALVSFFVKLIFFYLHERLWHQIPYGKRNHEQETQVRS